MYLCVACRVPVNLPLEEKRGNTHILKNIEERGGNINMLKNYGLCGSLSNIELLQGKAQHSAKPENLQSEIREPCEIIEDQKSRLLA